MTISIITVVLNNKPYVEDCIRSVIHQSHKDLEYMIIDGGSTDGTVNAITPYERHLSKWISEPDGGIYDAMNKGIKWASGDVIGMLNADDFYIDEGVLEKVATVMADAYVDACYADLVYVDRENADKVIRYWRSRSFEPGLFASGWVPAHPTFFVRKKIYDRYGIFDVNYKLAADYELMARLFERYRIRTVYIPEVLVKMRVGGVTGNSVLNRIKQNIEILAACKQNRIKISPLSFMMKKFMIRMHQFSQKKMV